MPRRKPRPKTQRQPNTTGGAGNHCRALVPVDGTAIRKKIKKDYEKALRDLDHSRQLLDQFQQVDQPQFSRWLNSHFGALLTELRELSVKLAEDEAIVIMVQNEVIFGGASYARAFKRVMDFKAHPTPPPPPGGDPEGKPDPFETGPDWEEPKDEDDPFKSIFEDMFGQPGPDDNFWGMPKEAFPAIAGTAHTAQRLKELYRAVVRRLHPDVHREMTAQKTEWWHQAQSAYEAGDAEQLEVILTLCEIGETGSTAQTSASLLQRITAQLKSSLREIKRQINQQRREPAWNFSNRTDHAAAAEKLRRDLTGELQAMQRRRQEIQAMIAKWKAASEKVKAPRRRKPEPEYPEFPF